MGEKKLRQSQNKAIEIRVIPNTCNAKLLYQREKSV